MQNQGYVKLYRKILDSDIQHFGATGIGFMTYCLLKANHKDNKWYDGTKYIDIKRGQFVTSSLELAHSLKLGRQVVRRILKRFEELQIITTRPTNKYTLITIVNYCKYQDSQKETTSKTASKQPAENQPSTTNKNVKNEKNKSVNSNELTGVPKVFKHYEMLFEKKFGRKPEIAFGKSGKHIKDKLHRYSDIELCQLMEIFSESAESERLGFTLELFLSPSVFNKLLSLKASRAKAGKFDHLITKA